MRLQPETIVRLVLAAVLLIGIAIGVGFCSGPLGAAIAATALLAVGVLIAWV